MSMEGFKKCKTSLHEDISGGPSCGKPDRLEIAKASLCNGFAEIANRACLTGDSLFWRVA